jgi:hypothetical protein
VSLVLGLRLGEDVYVEDRAFVLTAIHSAGQAAIQDVQTGRTFDIRVDRGTEVLPDVSIAMGDRSTTVMARISIDAPRHRKVLTGAKRRELHRNKEAVRPPPPTGRGARAISVPDDIMAKAKELGIFGRHAEPRLKEMVKLSTPITLPGYNRRYQQFVFFVEGDALIAVDELGAEDRAYYDCRQYEERREDDDYTAGEPVVE